MNQPLARYGHVLRTRWRWVLWGVLSALLITTVAMLVSPPVYRSEATVFVRTPGDVSRVQDGGDLYARARVGTYAALAKGTGVSERVVADLGLDLTPEEFSRRVGAEPRPNTAMLDLSVKAPSSSEAQRGVTVLISELQSTVQTLEAVPGLVVPRAELVVVDPPSPAQRIVARGVPAVALLLGVTLVGAVLGGLGAVLSSMSVGPVEGGEWSGQQEFAFLAAPAAASIAKSLSSNGSPETISGASGDDGPRIAGRHRRNHRDRKLDHT